MTKEETLDALRSAEKSHIGTDQKMYDMLTKNTFYPQAVLQIVKFDLIKESDLYFI